MPLELFGTTGTAAVRPAVGGATGAQPPTGPAEAFANSLERLLDGVEQRSAEANVAVTNMLDKTGEVHDAMIAIQRAEMTLQFTVQIRNKLVQAYQEIMRMPV